MRNSLGHIGHVVKSFLDERWDQKSPLLIAYSGGPDSKALLYAAIDWGKAPIHIAHIDHGWREESQSEAEILRKEAEHLGICFHHIRLTQKTTEEEARVCRLDFYRKLIQKFSFQAVLLGHQADDLAETVLKRIFEGAHLPQLGAMRAVTDMEGVTIWRPMLTISKNQIEEWLKSRHLTPLYDPTNQDPRYLRSRMRSELIPWLNQSFGKNVSLNLCRLSERSHEWDEYLAWRIGQLQDRLAQGPFGCWIDGQGLHKMELRALLRKMAQKESFVFSNPVLENILLWMEQKIPNRLIRMSQRHIVVDRGHFFLLARLLPRFDQNVTLPINGIQQSGDWTIEEVSSSVSCRWQDLWRTGAAVQAFDGQTILALPSKMRWKQKIPAFLRKICPILTSGERNLDFLSGKPGSGKRAVKIFVNS